MFYYNLHKTNTVNPSKKIIDFIFGTISKEIKITQKWTLNIVFLDDLEIQKLNKKYRKIDKPTDVLSFHYFDDFSNLKKSDIAWEIIMSESKIISQAKEYSNSIEEEFYKLLIHSTLHIIWFDHEEEKDYKKMRKTEDKIIKMVNILKTESKSTRAGSIINLRNKSY